MYLENILENMTSKTDVIVNLSSYTTYEITGATMQDSCGNHHVENWLDAIELDSTQKVFVVDTISVDTSPFKDKPQWIITLVNEKSYMTDLLERTSNEVACRRCWS